MNKILIVDGHAFAFRAYYAFQAANLKNSLTGKPSGAVFGFFRMLFKILGDFQPTHLVIPFDPGTPLERNKMFKDYKANRKPMPEDLRPQIKQIISMCEEFGFPISKIAGHEADDIIGTLSKQYAKGKNKVIIFSGDKDMFQLLSNQSVSMLRGKKGVTEFLEITKDTVKDMLGVTYNQVIDYMGIVGDTADNIPGVKGIGEKGAANLLTEYKNLEEIYKNVDKIKSKATKQKLLDHKDMAFLSRDLATIKTDLSLDLTLDDMKIVDYLKPERLNILKQQGFNALYRDMSKLAGVQVAEEPDNSLDIKSAKADYVLVESLDELKKVVKEFSKASAFCIDTETTAKEPVKAELLGFSLCYKAKKAYYVPVAYEESLFSQKSLQIADVVPILQPLLSNSKSLKIGQNIKYDMIVLQKYGLEFKGPIFDTMLASYVIQPEGRRHNMDALAKDYLNYNTIKYSDLVGSGRKKRALYEIDPQEVKGYACEDADITFQLYKVLEKKLEKLPTKSIYEKIEIPLIPVLVASESNGVSIDLEYFSKLSKQFKDKIKELEKSIHELAGKTFNIASTQELQVVLFEELNLPPSKKTKTGYSTDHSVMEDLLGQHPIIEEILEYRKYTKLSSTYIEALPNLVYHKTNKLHTSYNQTIAATGRLSSTDPNLQNIPIKDEEGKLIRKGFVVGKRGFSLLSLDYSQIELRIMAHFSNDKNMIEAYKKDYDIHAKTASAIYSVAEKDVTPEMRNRAKAVNFSVIYGVTPFGLSKNLRISRDEAKNFIEKYFEAYPGVKKFMDDICESGKEKGYVETLMGRRRYVPGLQASKRQEVEAAKRVAINSPIQGTSADMIKMAMIKIYKALEKSKMQSKLILQVHDELVFEVHNKEKDELFELAKKEMEKVLKLKVPIVVQGRFGKNWDEAH